MEAWRYNNTEVQLRHLGVGHTGCFFSSLMKTLFLIFLQLRYSTLRSGVIKRPSSIVPYHKQWSYFLLSRGLCQGLVTFPYPSIYVINRTLRRRNSAHLLQYVLRVVMHFQLVSANHLIKGNYIRVEEGTATLTPSPTSPVVTSTLPAWRPRT